MASREASVRWKVMGVGLNEVRGGNSSVRGVISELETDLVGYK